MAKKKKDKAKKADKKSKSKKGKWLKADDPLKRFKVSKYCNEKYDPVLFNLRENPWGLFSNFAPTPFIAPPLWGGDPRLWFNNEQWFMAHKMDVDNGGSATADLLNKILWAYHPDKCRYFASQKAGGLMRENWDKDNQLRHTVMLVGLRHKYQQNPLAAQALIESGERLLVENVSFDDYWGNGKDGNGSNNLGKLHMIVREELRSGELPILNNTQLADLVGGH
ncbi:hypothetical protein GR7B_00223 [Vibrio phage vB_VcorM_GR7B]|nr:hypothetical protein GR7B_00223 [Vibrio phage vB_VcorM_GR7B]